ncbi:MAG: fumarate hydratase [Desulfovibrio sp.]|nr:fumarate hydratase [Desulfovibrio sp.]
MRDIDCKDIAEAVAKLAVEACCILPEDVVESFRAHQAAEPSPVGRNILQQLLDNAGIAQATKTPLCQDTGLAVIFADVGQEVHIVGGAFAFPLF